MTITLWHCENCGKDNYISDSHCITCGKSCLDTKKTKPQKGVYFEIDPGTPTSCGITCRKILASLTNTGEVDAHNVKVNFDIYNSAGDSVYSTQEQLGDIASGQSKSKTITMHINCGSALTLYSKCRKHMPLTLRVKILFDEGIQIFPDYVYNTTF